MANEFFVVMDDDSEELVRKLSSETGVSSDGIISRVFGASMPQLSEYLTWMLTLEKGSDLHQKGKNLVISYGPESLVEGIKRLDPEYQTLTQLFVESIKQPLAAIGQQEGGE